MTTAIALFYILEALVPCLLLHLAALALAGAAVGMVVEKVSYFVGPTLFRFWLRNTEVSFQLVPLSGHVKYEKKSFDKVGPVRQSLTLISGCTALLLWSGVLIGPQTAIAALASGYREIIEGALFPISTGASHVASALEFARRAHYLELVGVVAAKFAAWHLLPLPGMNLGQFLLVNVVAFFKLSERVHIRLLMASLVLVMLLYASWLLAFGTYLMAPAFALAAAQHQVQTRQIDAWWIHVERDATELLRPHLTNSRGRMNPITRHEMLFAVFMLGTYAVSARQWLASRRYRQRGEPAPESFETFTTEMYAAAVGATILAGIDVAWRLLF